MNKFNERLKELREEKNLTKSQLAKESGIPRTSIKCWELKQRVPNLDAVIALADYFKVTLDYIAGRED